MTTRARVDDSDRFCPRDQCQKRLMVEIGENTFTGVTELWHVCWSCGYEERDREWTPAPAAHRRSRGWVAGSGAARRLERQRLA